MNNVQECQLFMNGQRTSGSFGELMDVINPTNIKS